MHTHTYKCIYITYFNVTFLTQFRLSGTKQSSCHQYKHKIRELPSQKFYGGSWCLVLYK